MDERYQEFCEGILEGKSLREAYTRAGFDAEGPSAASGAQKLLDNPEVQLYLAVRRREIQERTGITSERITQAIAESAFFDPIEVAMAEVHRPEDIAKLPAHVRSCIKGWKWDRMGNFTLQFVDKSKARDQLAKMYGLYQKDRENDADRAANLLESVFWRFVTSLHISQGMPIAEATNFARNNPDQVETWGRKVGLLTEGDAGQEIVVDDG